MVLVFSLIGVLSGSAWAAGQSDMPRSGSEFNTNQNQISRQEPGMPGSDAVLQRASKLIGSNVKSSDGKNLGTIRDIVLTPDLNSVSYIALARGGAFGLNRDLYAIPWSALKTGIDGTYYLPITEGQLDVAKGFKEAYWPNAPARGWMAADEGMEPVFRGATPEQSRDVQNRRVSQLLGTNVTHTDGTKGGSVKDMVIASDSGQVVYTIVSYGGVFGLGARYAAVPTAAIDLQPERGIAALKADRSALVANSFSPGQWPDMSDPAIAQREAILYGTQPRGAVFGYVPPESDVTAEPKAGIHEPAKESEGASLGYQPPTETPAAMSFDPANVRTIEGTVVGISKLGAGAPSADTLSLRLRTAEGKIVAVNLGPRDYISKQNFYVVNGDRISVTGSEVTVGERPTFLATEVKIGDQTLRLRNPSGHPLWLQSSASSIEESEDMGATGYVSPESSADAGRTHERARTCPSY
jgi:sporulation protein YlmC with PRC-barrel domain